MESTASSGGTLRAELSTLGAEVIIRQSQTVPHELWVSLGRGMDADRNPFPDALRVLVGLEKFVASRSWLQGRLAAYQTRLEVDERLAALLRRSQMDARALRSVLDRTMEYTDTATTVMAELAATRFDLNRRHPTGFQLESIAHLLDLPHGANFSVPGAGKTATTLALYEILHQRGQLSRVLVVAPLSAHEAWIEEGSDCFTPGLHVRRFNDKTPRTEVVVISYQSLERRLDEIAAWMRDGQTHLVLDEAHRIKRGPSGLWGRMCLSLAPLAARRDILTGTPAPQSPRDLFAEFNFLWPGQQNRILQPIVNSAQPSPEAMRVLSQRIGPLFVRTQKSQLGLPDPDLKSVPISMGPVQSQIYQHMRTSARLAGNQLERRLQTMGGVVTHLIQAASNPGILAQSLSGAQGADHRWPPLGQLLSPDMAELVRSYGDLEMPEKYKELASRVSRNTADNRKTLVWSNFVGNLRILEESILAPYEPALIYGGVPSGDEDADFRTREKELRRFRTDPNCSVLLANPAAMSEGVSLHMVCSDAIYVDRTFNAGQYLQSIDRIHRLGMSPDAHVRVRFLESTQTVDDVVNSRVRAKAETLSAVLCDPNIVTMSLPDEDEISDGYDDADLDALFSHLSGQP